MKFTGKRKVGRVRVIHMQCLLDPYSGYLVNVVLNLESNKDSHFTPANKTFPSIHFQLISVSVAVSHHHPHIRTGKKK